MAAHDSPFWYIILFDTVTILSFVLLGAVTATAFFSTRVRRRKPWYGQMAQWLVYCVSYMLLFGFQGRNSVPPRFLCMLQASLIYACPPACAVGSTCFMIDFYMMLSLLHRKPTKKIPKLELLLVSLPWVVLIGTALQTILFTVHNGESNILQRSPGGHFCNISKQEPTNVSVVLVLVALTVWFYYEVRTGIIMYQNGQEFKDLNYEVSRGLLSLYVRSAIFTMGMVIATGLTIYCLSSSSRSEATWSLLLPFMPIFVAVVFGGQKDIMQVWFFWRKRKSEDEEAYILTPRFSLTSVPEIPSRKPIDVPL